MVFDALDVLDVFDNVEQPHHGDNSRMDIPEGSMDLASDLWMYKVESIARSSNNMMDQLSTYPFLPLLSPCLGL